MQTDGGAVSFHTDSTDVIVQDNGTLICINAYLKYSSLYQLPINYLGLAKKSWINKNVLWCPSDFRWFLQASGVSLNSLRILSDIPEANQTLSFTWSLLENSMSTGKNAKHMLFSSRAVYGVPLYSPVDEFHPLKPRTVYGLLKAVQEQIYRYFSLEKDISICILRISDVYGPMKKSSKHYLGTIPRFILSACQAGKIEINGNGHF
jgi:hypothetical protein